MITISVYVMSPSAYMEMKKSCRKAENLLKRLQSAGKNHRTFHSRPALSKTVEEYIAVTRKLLTKHRILEGTQLYDRLSYKVSQLIDEFRQQQAKFEAGFQ